MKRKMTLLAILLTITSLSITACNTQKSTVSLDSDEFISKQTEIIEDTKNIKNIVISEESKEVSTPSKASSSEYSDTIEEPVPTETSMPTENPTSIEPPSPTEEPISTEESALTEDVKGISTVEIQDVNETVWANTNCNVRSGYSVDTEKVGSLSYAQSITRTGIVSNGWSRVDYNGTVAYIKSSLLSTEEIVKPATVQVEVSVIIDNYAYEILTLVNEYRAENGISELTWNQGLADAAAIRSAEAAVCWSHTRPDGSAWNTVSDLTHGENLGRGYNTPQDVVNAWKASPSHNANLLDSRFKTLGVAYTLNERGYVWAQEFGY